MIDYNKDVMKYLKKNRGIAQGIIKKIDACLETYLLVSVRSCNKHELKGNCKGRWRLHVPHGHVIIYRIVGEMPNRHAHVLKTLTEEKYHNWISGC